MQEAQMKKKVGGWKLGAPPKEDPHIDMSPSEENGAISHCKQVKAGRGDYVASAINICGRVPAYFMAEAT
jgi:hypothetical protein